MTEAKRFALRDHIPFVVSTVSMVFLLGTIAVIVTTIIRRSRQTQAPPPVKARPVLSDQVISITEGYKYTTTEQGRRRFLLAAARDTSYADGRHELDKLDLTAFATDGRESLRIFADRGSYRQEEGVVQLTGKVKVTNQDGVEVLTESLLYNQKEELATTDQALQFRRAALDGCATGAILNSKNHTLQLLKDVQIIHAASPKAKDGRPVVVRSQRADFVQDQGIIKFSGDANVTHLTDNARGDTISGFLDPKTQLLQRIELRSQSVLRSDEKGKTSLLEARDIDFFFDAEQQLKNAVAVGGAHARSLEKDAPRDISAEKLEANFIAAKTSSLLQSVTSHGRTTLKVSPAPDAAKQKKPVVESVFEADSIKATFDKDGKFLANAEAIGNTVLTMTPLVITPDADKKRVTVPRLKVDFYETGNIIKSFTGEGGATVVLEPMAPKTKRTRRTLSGKNVVGQVSKTTEDISHLAIDGDARLVDGKREATAAHATYSAATQIVALRGKPVVWDEASRTNADEIDANVEDQQSFARGRVRTTYYSRETTGGAAPFKNSKAPVFITAERAIVRHQEGAARYLGDVRAWQEDNFITAETVELDSRERQLQAWTNVESAIYSVEREIEPGKKEIVPTFVSADRMDYRDDTRIVNYDGNVRMRQATDKIDAAIAQATIDEEHNLTKLTASRNVVLTQPMRRATGDQIEYTAKGETAVLTGNPAEVEDKERSATTKGARLTMHLRDARIQVTDDKGAKRIRTTHRIQR